MSSFSLSLHIFSTFFKEPEAITFMPPIKGAKSGANV